MTEKNFTARAFWSKATSKPVERVGFREAFLAVEWGESWLSRVGVPDESYVEVRFNGEDEIHSFVRIDDEGDLELWNSKTAQWPVLIVGDGADGTIMMTDEEAERVLSDIEQEKTGTHEKHAESGDTFQDEAEDEQQAKSDDGEDEDPESDSDSSGDEEDEDTADEDEEAEDGSDEATDGAGADSEGGDEGEGETDGSGDDEREAPRVKVFGKFKGPKGWRKRADSDPERYRNRFQFVIGQLDEEAETTRQQERTRLVRVEFTEQEDNPNEGLLVIHFREELEIEPGQFRQWIDIPIPFVRDDD